jgi:hypothetical protein
VDSQLCALAESVAYFAVTSLTFWRADQNLNHTVREGFRKGRKNLELGRLARRAKKSGLVAVTLNLRSQPRLPGSVVGEASMRVAGKTDKIT